MFPRFAVVLRVAASMYALLYGYIDCIRFPSSCKPGDHGASSIFYGCCRFTCNA